MDNRKLGANLKRLIAYKVAKDMHPNGGGIGAAMDALTKSLTTPGRMIELYRNALVWCDQAIAVLRAAPDNPYGNDEETICGAILAELEKGK